VICSDIARYGIATAGEPTQGAGAIAMVIKRDPSLIAFDVGVTGASSTHVHDFWRPLGQREAQVDGHYSVECYLDAVTTAYRGWAVQAIARGLVTSPASEQLARICYHVPFCKMAKKAHLQLRRCDADDAGITFDELAAIQSFSTQVEPSLPLCSRIGNVYTGSLYLGLAGVLDAQADQLVDRRIGMFSYGSGCTSEFFSGVVSPRAASRIAEAQLANVLAARERISIAEYERIMNLATPMTGDGFRFTGVVDHRRQYAR
jgi:hydroxymethylglutaryl-CoA synthase